MKLAQTRDVVDGVLLLNKPRGLSSQQAVGCIKRLFSAKKAGHTGTLDPLADGLLPIGLGEATKFTQFLLDADKTYLATIALGAVTTTGDAEGEVLKERLVNLSREQIDQVIPKFIGAITQVPPMYSAIKLNGKPLYTYARNGQSIDRESRSIFINSLEVIDFIGSSLTVRVSCSKGTYIRVLAEDIGDALQCGAHLASLTREQAGQFRLSDAIGIDELERLDLPARRVLLKPLDSFADTLPVLKLVDADKSRLLKGQSVTIEQIINSQYRLFGLNGEFFGVGAVLDGVLSVQRLLNTQLSIKSLKELE